MLDVKPAAERPRARLVQRDPHLMHKTRPDPIRDIVIIGNGIAGVTAARFIRKLSDDRITIVSDESDFFFSRTALMYVYMGHMTLSDIKPYEDWFWEKNRIDRVRGYVRHVDCTRQRLELDGAEPIDYDVLIIASGSKSNRFNWPGDDLSGVHGLYFLQDLERLDRESAGVRKAVVVGGGLTGVELVEMLHSRGIHATFLAREMAYMDYALPTEEAELIERAIRRHGIDLRFNTEVREIRAGADGRVASVLTSRDEELSAQLVGITCGVHPNVAFLRESDVETNSGVLVNEHFETSVPNVYAVGDCAEFRDDGIGHKRIEQLWYTGRTHGKFVGRIVCGQRKPYDRGIFYNSAKFFDLEYQTYGEVDATLQQGMEDCVLRDQRSERMVRIRFRSDTHAVTGFNALGFRLRHEDCERCIRHGTTVDDVLAGFEALRFDPEFNTRRPELREAV